MAASQQALQVQQRLRQGWVDRQRCRRRRSSSLLQFGWRLLRFRVCVVLPMRSHAGPGCMKRDSEQWYNNDNNNDVMMMNDAASAPYHFLVASTAGAAAAAVGAPPDPPCAKIRQEGVETLQRTGALDACNRYRRRRTPQLARGLGFMVRLRV